MLTGHSRVQKGVRVHVCGGSLRHWIPHILLCPSLGRLLLLHHLLISTPRQTDTPDWAVLCSSTRTHALWKHTKRPPQSKPLLLYSVSTSGSDLETTSRSPLFPSSPPRLVGVRVRVKLSCKRMYKLVCKHGLRRLCLLCKLWINIHIKTTSARSTHARKHTAWLLFS